jgi:hypothetical protein
LLLTIENQLCIFTSLSQFRDLYRLPARFNGALFNTPRLKTPVVIDSAGINTLQHIADDLLACIPACKPRHGWYPFTVTLQKAFRRRLIIYRLCIPLTENQIEQAVCALGDVTRTYIYACLQAGTREQRFPDFDEVYSKWLSRHVLPSEQVYTLRMLDQVWEITPLNDPFGLFGLRIETECGVHHVYDDERCSPMVEFLDMLLRAISERFAKLVCHP